MACPREIGLLAEGPILESDPTFVNLKALQRVWETHPILVLPGFYGVNAAGHTALFGRGGSDQSALFLAAELDAGCRLLKDVPGVYDSDPASSTAAHRFCALSWERAIEVAGPLIQPKALRYARDRDTLFEVGRPNETAGTWVGTRYDEWAPPAVGARAAAALAKPVGVALLGAGVVGRGVYETLRRYRDRFEIRHVVVRELARYPDLDQRTTDPSVILQDAVDVVVVCFGGVRPAYSLIAAALNAGKFVITPNKAVVAAHGESLAPYARGAGRRLWYSAAVGGALPALDSPVRELRGIINGTCGVVLEAWSQGSTRHDAVALAQAQGFAEADPARDLSGRDSADKLALLMEAAFGEWIDPERIPTRGIDAIQGEPNGYQLIARATREGSRVVASVAPEMPPESFLGQARGAENRLEIELVSGEVVRLRGQGAGPWPTTVSLMGDLHEVARIIETSAVSDG